MNQKEGKILVIDDNTDILFALKLLLKNQVERIDTETDPYKIPSLLRKEEYDVILLDMNFTKDAISGQEGFFWLEKVLQVDPGAVVLFITAYGDTEKAVKAIKAGATDFIQKPWQNDKLVATISAALKLRKSKQNADELRSKQIGMSEANDKPFQDFIGTSPKMLKVFETIRKVAETDASVLILGENGTGKEVVARALHRNSQRKNEVFISVDLGSIAETLFESELFGHEKGAFTDAIKEKPGRFELANDGTLFLDEIGNLSLPMQAKLLSVLERREITRVGSTKTKAIDIRLICATNIPVLEWISQGKFRQDLLYRINTVEIHLPPLRERQEDLPLLANHFLQVYAKKYMKKMKGISASALRKLEQYAWPGNIRELQHAIERAVIMSDTDKLEPQDFILSSSMDSKSNFDLPDGNNLDDLERNVISKVLAKHKGNVSHAAKELGLTRTSLYRRLDKHGL